MLLMFAVYFADNKNIELVYSGERVRGESSSQLYSQDSRPTEFSPWHDTDSSDGHKVPLCSQPSFHSVSCWTGNSNGSQSVGSGLSEAIVRVFSCCIFVSAVCSCMLGFGIWLYIDDVLKQWTIYLLLHS